VNLIQKLQKEIFNLTGGYIATWLPDFDPFIGDFGAIARGRLLTDGNLEELGYIDAQKFIGVSSTKSFKYTSDVSISAESSGGPALGYVVTFNKEGSFIYHFQNAAHHRIENKRAFFKELAHKILTGVIPWDDSYVIVDEVFIAETSTILISKSSKGVVNIKSDGSVKEIPNFADSKLNLAFSISKGTIFDYAGQTDTRPLFHAVKPTIKPKGSVGGTRGPKPTGPSLSSFYDYAKRLVKDRDIKPTEIELYAVEDNLLEAVLTLNGRSAKFDIVFENLTPDYIMKDNLGDEEEIIAIENVLVFGD